MMTIEEIEQACKSSQPVSLGNNAHSRMEFPLRRRLYPLGFPADISTNSQEVLDVAAESWGEFHRLFHTPPIRIQAGVLPGRSGELPPAPQIRVHQNLFTFTADQDNFGIVDMVDSFACMWLTPEAIENREYLRHFFVECAIVCPIATRFSTGVHSACVSLNGVGVLLCGDSSAGKSTLAYACAKVGWTYVTDDGSYMVHGSDRLQVVGNCHQVRFRASAASLFPEIAGHPITQRAGRGKPSIELRSASLPHIRVAQTADIKFVVFLNRRESQNTPLRPYSKEVVRHFLRQGRFAPATQMPSHFAAINRLLELDVLELRYNDLDWALAQLNDLVGAGHP